MYNALAWRIVPVIACYESHVVLHEIVKDTCCCTYTVGNLYPDAVKGERRSFHGISNTATLTSSCKIISSVNSIQGNHPNLGIRTYVSFAS